MTSLTIEANPTRQRRAQGQKVDEELSLRSFLDGSIAGVVGAGSIAVPSQQYSHRRAYPSSS